MLIAKKWGPFVWGSSPLTHSVAYIGIFCLSSPCPGGIGPQETGTNADSLAIAIAIAISRLGALWLLPTSMKLW